MEQEPVLDFTNLHIHPNDVQEAMKAFKWFHSKRTGMLKKEELNKAFDSLGLKVSLQEIGKMLENIQKPSETNEEIMQVTLPQFLHITLKKIHQINMQDDLMALFHLYDLDRKGKLSKEEIQFLAFKLLADLHLRPSLVDSLIAQCTKDAQCLIDYKQFVKLLAQEL
jgi:Ca2+-binding EF-hand superfamily protein